MFSEVSHYVPMWLTNIAYDHFPAAGLDYLRRNRDLAHKVAKDLIASHSETAASEKNSSKDVMSILSQFLTSYPHCDLCLLSGN